MIASNAAQLAVLLEAMNTALEVDNAEALLQEMDAILKPAIILIIAVLAIHLVQKKQHLVLLITTFMNTVTAVEAHVHRAIAVLLGKV